MTITKVNVAIRLSALGDLVLTTAFLQDLQQQAENTPCYFVSQSHFIPFIQNSFPGDRQYYGVSKQRPFSWWHWFRQGVTLGQTISTTHPSLQQLALYDLHGVFKSRLIEAGLRWALRGKAPQFTVKRSPKNSWLRWKSIFFRQDLIEANHFYIRHRQLLNSEGHSTPRLIANKVKNFSGPTLLIAPEASKWKKIWPLDYWTQLLTELSEHPLKFNLLLVGSRQALPTKLCKDLQHRAPDRVVNLLGQLQLQDLPSVAASCQLALSSNSAWLHIAEAVGVPVLAFAGPIVPGFGFSPWKSDSEELSVALNCRPCTRHGGGRCRPKSNTFHACMRDIRPEFVRDKIITKITDLGFK